MNHSLFTVLILKIALSKVFLLKLMIFVDECTSQLPKVPTVSLQTIMYLLSVDTLVIYKHSVNEQCFGRTLNLLHSILKGCRGLELLVI